MIITPRFRLLMRARRAWWWLWNLPALAIEIVHAYSLYLLAVLSVAVLGWDAAERYAQRRRDNWRRRNQ